MAISCTVKQGAQSAANAATYAAENGWTPTGCSMQLAIGAVNGTVTNPLTVVKRASPVPWKNEAQTGFHTNADQLAIFSALPGPNTSPSTPVLGCAGDNGTGASFLCLEVNGQEGSYIRQTAVGTGTANPTVTFGQAPLAGNLVIIGLTIALSQSTGAVAPATFTSLVNTSAATPVQGFAAWQSTSVTATTYVTSHGGVATGWFGVEVYIPGNVPLSYSDPFGAGGVIY